MIKRLLILTRLPKIELAKLLGVHRNSINNYKNHKIPPYMRQYLLLSEYIIREKGVKLYKEIIHD